MNTMKIACVGDACTDIYVNGDTRMTVGGNAVNVSIAVKRSGISSSFVGMVGTDEKGTIIKNRLKEEGVDISHVVAHPGTTAWCRIVLRDGERFIDAEDLGIQKHYQVSDEDFTFVSMHDFAHFTAFTNWPSALSGDMENYHNLMSAYIHRLHGLGVPISVDFSDADVSELLELVHGKVSVGFFSRPIYDDEHIRTEAKKLMNHGFDVVVLTRGSAGSCAFDGNDYLFQEALPIEIVDSLGAGDSFIGAFISNWVKRVPLGECLRYGAAYAAEICSRFGGL